MRAPIPSYVCSILLANHPPAYGLTAVQRHWRRLAGSPPTLIGPSSTICAARGREAGPSQA
jgi:hypothetical protein